MATSLSLPAELAIYTANEVRAQLLDMAQAAPLSETHLHVDASAVSEIDGAGLQLLISLDKSLRSRGQRLVLASPSTCVQQAMQLAGATHLACVDPGKEVPHVGT